eukprot:scaffold1938_cov399-Prasinococcus_capsulatus_cf.AAC.11
MALGSELSDPIAGDDLPVEVRFLQEYPQQVTAPQQQWRPRRADPPANCTLPPSRCAAYPLAGGFGDTTHRVTLLHDASVSTYLHIRVGQSVPLAVRPHVPYGVVERFDRAQLPLLISANQVPAAAKHRRVSPSHWLVGASAVDRWSTGGASRPVYRVREGHLRLNGAAQAPPRQPSESAMVPAGPALHRRCAPTGRVCCEQGEWQVHLYPSITGSCGVRPEATGRAWRCCRCGVGDWPGAGATSPSAPPRTTTHVHPSLRCEDGRTCRATASPERRALACLSEHATRGGLAHTDRWRAAKLHADGPRIIIAARVDSAPKLLAGPSGPRPEVKLWPKSMKKAPGAGGRGGAAVERDGFYDPSPNPEGAR